MFAEVKDIATIGESTPLNAICISSIGYFRGEVEEQKSDPSFVAIELLLDQFKRPIRDYEV